MNDERTTRAEFLRLMIADDWRHNAKKTILWKEVNGTRYKCSVEPLCNRIYRWEGRWVFVKGSYFKRLGVYG